MKYTDEDFEAFCALASSQSTLNVLVTSAELKPVLTSPPYVPTGASAFPSNVVRVCTQYAYQVAYSLQSASSAGLQKKMRRRRNRELTGQLPASVPISPPPQPVAGPSKVAGSHDISSPHTKKKHQTVTDTTLQDIDVVSPKKRKKRTRDDPYVNAEQTAATLDLDSVPPEESLPPVENKKKSKKRKLQEADADAGTEAAVSLPVGEGEPAAEAAASEHVPENRKSKKKRRLETPTRPADELVAFAQASVMSTGTDTDHPPKKKKKKSRWRWASRWEAELPSGVASHDARCQVQAEREELKIVLASSRVKCDGKVEKATVLCSRRLQSVKAYR